MATSDRSVGLADLAARAQAGPSATRRAHSIKEAWRRVPGFPQYYVSNFGRVRSYVRSEEGKLLSPRTHRHKNGYVTELTVVLVSPAKPRNVFNIGSLVLLGFVGPKPQGCETCHRDGDPTNNRAWNLRWGTHKENTQDCIGHKRFHFEAGRIKGSKHARAKLNETTVLQARKLHAHGVTYVDILRAINVNVALATLGKAIRGEKWAHVNG